MKPVIADVDFQHVRELGNRLLEQINAVRQRAPIFWSPAQKAWVISGHAAVAEGFSGRLPFSNERMSKVGRFMPDPEERARRIPTVLRLYPLQLVGLDPPAHGRMRRLLMSAFSRSVVERTRAFAKDVIDESLNRVADGRVIDFVDQVSRVIPGRVILHLMGLSDKYLPDLAHWSSSVIAGLGGGANTPDVLDETERTFRILEELLKQEVAQRRGHEKADFLSTLMTTEFDGDRLTEDEIVSTCIMTMLAGNDTTANTIALSAAALARNPQAWGYMREHPDRMPEIVLEMMRYIAMATTQTRMVAKDFEWHGHQLHKGDLVYLMIAGANRDPAKFPDPERLDPTRPQDGNMTFGPGMHMCIGHLLAKMQMQEFFAELVRRFDGIELQDEDLQWHSSLAFRGLRSLKLRLIPARSTANA
jgi:pimeloyl-[acyl-carrier protein] synthase